MTHSFHFDPSNILGVAPGATLREIRDAYHQKSLKYHPDKGGDEWAFRMVARAYEILSTARVVDRSSDEITRPGAPQPQPGPEVPPRANWTDHFGTGTPPPRPGTDPDSTNNLKGWGGAPRTHAGLSLPDLSRIVMVELLILRFELECSIDIFARNPEDRNLSCSIHINWPVAELAEQVRIIPEAARTVKRIGDAFKARGVRKHALNKRINTDDGRFEGWLTYPTAVMASEALEAFREALAEHGLEVEKQVREMAIPRQWS